MPATKTRKLNTPYADLLPPLKTSEREALAADIKANGVLHPVVIDEHGNILDGHHRYSIDRNAPTVTVEGLSEDEKRAYTIRANLARRNLTGDCMIERGLDVVVCDASGSALEPDAWPDSWQNNPKARLLQASLSEVWNKEEPF